MEMKEKKIIPNEFNLLMYDPIEDTDPIDEFSLFNNNQGKKIKEEKEDLTNIIQSRETKNKKNLLNFELFKEEGNYDNDNNTMNNRNAINRIRESHNRKYMKNSNIDLDIIENNNINKNNFSSMKDKQ
jgi:hypothetical protein